MKRAYSSSSSSMVKEVSVTMVRTCKGAGAASKQLTPRKPLGSFSSSATLERGSQREGEPGGAGQGISPFFPPPQTAALQRAYHVAFGGVLQGLDHFQPLLESHLFNQICPDSSKFLERSNFGVSEKMCSSTEWPCGGHVRCHARAYTQGHTQGHTHGLTHRVTYTDQWKHL